jgi:hypothetical protein
VIDIGGKKREKRGDRRLVTAQRNMQFIRRNDPQFRVTKLPPELVTDYHYVQGCIWLGRILNREDHARCRQEEHDDDKDWNDGPGEFNLRASVDLCGFTQPVRAPPAELDYGVREKPSHHKKNAAGYGQGEPCDRSDFVSWR